MRSCVTCRSSAVRYGAASRATDVTFCKSCFDSNKGWQTKSFCESFWVLQALFGGSFPKALRRA